MRARKKCERARRPVGAVIREISCRCARVWSLRGARLRGAGWRGGVERERDRGDRARGNLCRARHELPGNSWCTVKREERKRERERK